MVRRFLVGLLVLALQAQPSLSHGSTEPRPPADPPPSDPPEPPPPPPPPPHDPTQPQGPGTPGPNPPGPQPPPPVPNPSPGQPAGPTTPPEKRPQVRKPVRDRRPSSAGTNTWRLWWELTREHLVGIRGTLRAAGTVTGTPTGERDPMAKRRGEVIAALRDTARNAEDRTLRAAAVIALGRMGEDGDAAFMVNLMHDRRQARDVHEACAVGLAILPPIKDEEIRKGVNAYLRYAVKNRGALPTRASGMALLAAGSRARHDRSLSMFLFSRLGAGKLTSDEAANLLFALGLAGNPIAVPELLQAVRKGTLGKKRLSDTARAHATMALARIGDSASADLLASVLRSRGAGLEVRRSAALGLARLLRERDLPKSDREFAGKALRRAFDKGRDTAVRGFAALAMGGAKEPFGLAALQEAIDHGGNATLKPFCALALGLAARTKDDRKLRSFLVEELSKTNDAEQGAALSIAVGLSDAEESRDMMLKRVTDKSLAMRMRGAAAQSLGLMSARDDATGRTLEEVALKATDPRLLEDVVLALGLIGRRGAARQLAEMLHNSKSGLLQGRLCLALSHLDHEVSVDALLKLLKDKRARSLVREFAAVGLGLMGDRREVDYLFDIDAYFNFYSTTIATHELVRLY
jgi:hypothetical protein